MSTSHIIHVSLQVEARGHVQLHGDEPGLNLQHDGGRDVGQLLLLHDPLALQQQLQSADPGQTQVPQPQADLREGREQGAGLSVQGARQHCAQIISVQ